MQSCHAHLLRGCWQFNQVILSPTTTSGHFLLRRRTLTTVFRILVLWQHNLSPPVLQLYHLMSAMSSSLSCHYLFLRSSPVSIIFLPYYFIFDHWHLSDFRYCSYVCSPSWIGCSLRGCVGNQHVTPSSTLIDTPPCFFYSISLWHRSSLLWYMNGHLRLFSFPLYSLVSLFCTSAFHSSRWGTVFFCFLQLYTYYFVPRLICALSRISTVGTYRRGAEVSTGVQGQAWQRGRCINGGMGILAAELVYQWWGRCIDGRMGILTVG